MCEFFVTADPILYESRTRTLRIHGVLTSIRLENLALAQEARAGFFPSVSANAGTSQQHSSSVNPVSGARIASRTTTSSVSVGASWMRDVWGRIRRSVEAGDASAEASQAELAAAPKVKAQFGPEVEDLLRQVEVRLRLQRFEKLADDARFSANRDLRGPVSPPDLTKSRHSCQEALAVFRAPAPRPRPDHRVAAPASATSSTSASEEQ